MPSLAKKTPQKTAGQGWRRHSRYRKDYRLAVISQSILLIQLGKESNPYFGNRRKGASRRTLDCMWLSSFTPSSRGPCDLHLFPQHMFVYPLLISKRFFISLQKKKKINKEKSHRRQVVCFKKEEKKWHLITYSSCLKIHVSLFSAWNLWKAL